MYRIQVRVYTVTSMGKEVEVSDKDEFLKGVAQLRPDLFFSPDTPEESKKSIEKEMRPSRVKTSMYSQIPMVCKGSDCVYAKTCPLLKEGNAPVGYGCPIEAGIVIEFANSYARELGVDPDNLIEMSMIRDLVDFEVQYMRAVKLLAQEHFIVENPVGVDANGDVIISKSLHQAIEYEDKILRRKHKMLDTFAATREAKNKAGSGTKDMSQVVSGLLDAVNDYRVKKDAVVIDAIARNREENLDTLDPYIMADKKDSEE